MIESAHFEPLPPELSPVLIVMIDHHLGNFCISLPVVQRLATHFDAPPDFLVDHRYTDLAHLLPAAVHVRAIRRRRGLRGIAYVRDLAVLVRRRYAAVIDLAHGIRSSTFVAATLSPVRIGREGRARARLYNRLLPAPGVMHTFDEYARYLECIGAAGPLPPFTIRASDPARAAVRSALRRELGEGESRLAVVHPGAGKTFRLWDADRFAAVADALVADHGMRICLIGAPGERPLMERVRSRMRRADAACCLSLPLVELLALFETASVLICNESGPMHLAALTPVPIVAIFGPTEIARWSPRRVGGVAALTGGACDPGCHANVCVADARCLRGVSVEDVLAAAERLLSGCATNEDRPLRNPHGSAARPCPASRRE